MLKDCYPIGTLQKPYGVNGEVIIRFSSKSSEEYKKLESVFIEIDKQPVPFFIFEYTVRTEDTAIIKFENIEIDQLKEFLGYTVLIEKSKIVIAPVTKKHKLISYQLFDTNKKLIGEIKDVIDYSGHNVFQVFRNKKEILIPANKDLIVNINKKQKIVIVEVSEGLLDIYL